MERWIRGSGSTFAKCGSQESDPDPRQNEMDPKRWLKPAEMLKNSKLFFLLVFLLRGSLFLAARYSGSTYILRLMARNGRVSRPFFFLRLNAVLLIFRWNGKVRHEITKHSNCKTIKGICCSWKKQVLRWQHWRLNFHRFRTLLHTDRRTYQLTDRHTLPIFQYNTSRGHKKQGFGSGSACFCPARIRIRAKR